MNSSMWYTELIKPTWAPPSWLFGPVWSVLYIIIAISFVYVGYLLVTKRIRFITALPFILNLGFNAAFTPIQFGLRNNVLALVDIILVLGTLIWALLSIRRKAAWVTYVNIPYLVWVTFATILQITITVLNA
jgi:translocator protein